MNKYDLSRGENHFLGEFYDLPQLLSDVTLNTYPDKNYLSLREKIGKYLENIKSSQILCTRGSHNAIDSILKCYLSRQDEAIILDPTYEYYEKHLSHYTSKIRKHSYNYREGIDITKLITDITNETKLIIIDSPSNPFGNTISNNDLVSLLNSGIRVVIDEEYIEFSAEKSKVSLINDYPNLIITRSLSKWAGLAGLRLSYIVSNSNSISEIEGVMCSYDLDTISQKVGEYALDNCTQILKPLNELGRVRDFLTNELKKLGLRVFGKDNPYLIIENPPFTQLPSFVYKHLSFDEVEYARFTIPNLGVAKLLINEIEK